MAFFAAFAMILAGVLIATESTDAVGEDLSETYGDPYVIDIAPGYSWEYEATFPESLTADVVLDAIVNDLGDAVTYSGQYNHTVNVTIPSETSVGNYNLVLRATHAASEQVTYQYIQFNVQGGIVITPAGENLGNTVVGTEKQFSFTANTTFSTISSVSATVTGLTVEEDYTVSVSGNTVTITLTPTEEMVGTEQQIVVTAEAAAGESVTKNYTFDVYRDFVLTPDHTTIGNQSDASAVISIPEGITVATWTGVDSLPKGVTWTAETRTLSVSSDAYIDAEITIGATSEDGQTADSIVINVHNESATLALNASEASVITYNDNAADPTVSFSVNESGAYSGIASGSYALSAPVTGVSVDADTGVVTIDSSAVSVQNGTTVTVLAETVFGMQIQGSFTLTVEGDLTFTDSNNTLILIIDDDHTVSSAAFNGAAENAEVTYTYDVQPAAGMTVSVDSGMLVADCSTPNSNYTVTITAHTAGGQTAQVVYTINVFAELTFTSEPENEVSGVGI